MNDVSRKEDVGARFRIIIAEDHAMVRAGLCMILEDEPDMQVVGEAEDGAQGRELALSLRPDVLLADVSMPPPDGLALARLLCLEAPEVKTIIVTMHEDRELVAEAWAAGAWGFVAKRSGPDELLAAIRAVMGGTRYLDARLREP